MVERYDLDLGFLPFRTYLWNIFKIFEEKKYFNSSANSSGISEIATRILWKRNLYEYFTTIIRMENTHKQLVRQYFTDFPTSCEWTIWSNLSRSTFKILSSLLSSSIKENKERKRSTYKPRYSISQINHVSAFNVLWLYSSKENNHARIYFYLKEDLCFPRCLLPNIDNKTKNVYT